MYGIQTILDIVSSAIWFENDVNMYGIQTKTIINHKEFEFENDVNMYGIQTTFSQTLEDLSLRMM